MVLIFKKGKWRVIELPNPVDPMWSKDDCLIYANVFCFFEEEGLKASQLAEAYIYKKLLGVTYDTIIEGQLALVGKA